jgi:hypothetical protein
VKSLTLKCSWFQAKDRIKEIYQQCHNPVAAAQNRTDFRNQEKVNTENAQCMALAFVPHCAVNNLIFCAASRTVNCCKKPPFIFKRHAHHLNITWKPTKDLKLFSQNAKQNPQNLLIRVSLTLRILLRNSYFLFIIVLLRLYLCN